MKPERRARYLLGITQAKAKMWEYGVPTEYHSIRIPEDPSPVALLDLAVGALGDFAAYTNGEPCDRALVSEKEDALRFASRFFDALPGSRLASGLDVYSALCAATCYYLCDMPGSSAVLASELDSDALALEAGDMAGVLLALLRDEPTLAGWLGTLPRGHPLGSLFEAYATFRQTGADRNATIEVAERLRQTAYRSGTPRELLLADAVAAVLRKRIEYSTWTCLPTFTDLAIDQWESAASKPTFIRELWPAQRLLGENGVLRGASAVVQMPTSAGKTKATELVVRSAFISGRTSLAVIVAPFRALCHEISGDLHAAFTGESIRVDELSDVLQGDFNVLAFLGRRQVLVVTPEKLHYVLRHHPELAAQIGLVIYDEGHLFDDSTRGVNYELLLAAIRRELPPGAQVLLISAVIANADQVREWLLGDGGKCVSGQGLSPTYRSVAFTSWTKTLGQLQFVAPEDPRQEEFFVPRVIEQTALLRQGGERVQRSFPEKGKPNDIALYLGLRLVSNGSVAVFCGRKDTASGICARAVECFGRGLRIPAPARSSDADEIHRLVVQHERNLGADADATRSATLGIFAHHAGMPHGIRLAVEHAMQKGQARFVVCTSTLAQGVNLPIRYLIVTSVYQGVDCMKVRDFQNLMGRVGRAGKHTEGTVIFADPKAFDNRKVHGRNWQWSQARDLLNPEKAEPCTSAIAEVLEPIHDDQQKNPLPTQPLDLANEYLTAPGRFAEIAATIAREHTGYSEDGVLSQLAAKATAIRAIQSYLLAHSDEWFMPDGEIGTDELAEATLAFAMADEAGKSNLRGLFRLLAGDLAARVPDAQRRNAFGRTLLGLTDCMATEAWVGQDIDQLLGCPDVDSLLGIMWPLLSEQIVNRTFRNCTSPESLRLVADGWLAGEPFDALFDRISDARIGRGDRPRKCTITHTVDLCENALGYEGSIIAGAVSEMVELQSPESEWLLRMLATFQKRLKYGLPGEREVILYELGFADRPLSQDLAQVLAQTEPSKRFILDALRARRRDIEAVLADYPSHFQNRLNMVTPRSAVSDWTW